MKNRVYILLAMLSIPLCSIASVTDGNSLNIASNYTAEISDFEKSIDLLGFEKRLSDRNEAFIIKNNTQNIIKSIELKVFYRTPTNDIINCRNITLNGEVEPNSIKQFSVESFDLDKRYYHIHSPKSNNIKSGYPFIITYKLIKYDISITDADFK